MKTLSPGDLGAVLGGLAAVLNGLGRVLGGLGAILGGLGAILEALGSETLVLQGSGSPRTGENMGVCVCSGEGFGAEGGTTGGE